MISSLSGSTRNMSDWLGKPRNSYAVSVMPDKLDIKIHKHGTHDKINYFVYACGQLCLEGEKYTKSYSFYRILLSLFTS